MRNATGIPSSHDSNGKPHEGKALDNHPVKGEGQNRHGDIKMQASSRTALHARTKNQTRWRRELTGTTVAATSCLCPQRGSPRPGASLGTSVSRGVCGPALHRATSTVATFRHDAPTSDGQRLCPPRRS